MDLLPKIRITDKIETPRGTILLADPSRRVQDPDFFLKQTVVFNNISYIVKEVQRDSCGSFGLVPIEKRTLYLRVEKL